MMPVKQKGKGEKVITTENKIEEKNKNNLYRYEGKE